MQLAAVFNPRRYAAGEYETSTGQIIKSYAPQNF